MKNKITYLVAIFICLLSFQAFASDSHEKIYLVQMINQLESLKPLIIAAAKEQPKNLRIQFHYTAYRDVTNKPHNGLLEDINEIEKGIQEKLNQTVSEPHRFAEIKGDYVSYEK